MSNWFSVVFKYREKKSPDVLGKYPEAVHVNAFPERRYLWTSRFLVICASFSLSLTIFLSITIYLLIPQRGAMPSLWVEQKMTSSLSAVNKQEVWVTADKLMEENTVRRYVKLRHKFNSEHNRQMNLWETDSEFFELSTPKIYNEFVRNMDYAKVASLISIGMNREVEIEYAEKMESGMWAVRFNTITSFEGNLDKLKEFWLAYIKVAYKKQDVNDKRTAYNPLNIKVIDYTLAYVGNDKKQETHMELARKAAESKE